VNTNICHKESFRITKRIRKEEENKTNKSAVQGSTPSFQREQSYPRPKASASQ